MNPLEALNGKTKTSAGKKNGLTAQENRVVKFFDATPLDWEDWRWQVRHRVTTRDVLEKMIKLVAGYK